MGRLFLRYVEADVVHCCTICGTHLASHNQIVSKAFQGRHGRAFLFADVVNVNEGPPEKRLLLTGLHVVADIYCNACETRLGWKYLEAYEEGQKYKEGKFILEKSMIIKEEDYRARVAEAEAEAARSLEETSDEDAMKLDSPEALSDGSEAADSPQEERHDARGVSSLGGAARLGTQGHAAGDGTENASEPMSIGVTAHSQPNERRGEGHPG